MTLICRQQIRFWAFDLLLYDVIVAFLSRPLSSNQADMQLKYFELLYRYGKKRKPHLDCLLLGSLSFDATLFSGKHNDLVASADELLYHKAPDIPSWSYN